MAPNRTTTALIDKYSLIKIKKMTKDHTNKAPREDAVVSGGELLQGRRGPIGGHVAVAELGARHARRQNDRAQSHEHNNRGAHRRR